MKRDFIMTNIAVVQVGQLSLKEFWPIQIKYLKATKTMGPRLKVTSPYGWTIELFRGELGDRDLFGNPSYLAQAEKCAVELCKFYNLAPPTGIGRLQNGDYVAITGSCVSYMAQSLVL